MVGAVIRFIAFAAFLLRSKAGDYFVNFAFAATGRTRGGPAKVAVVASGLMDTINGTSAGNVVSTGSPPTIPIEIVMKTPRTGQFGPIFTVINESATGLLAWAGGVFCSLSVLRPFPAPVGAAARSLRGESR